MKTKIINILPHPPCYEAYLKEPRPHINWDTPFGQWVGIWGYDWPDQLGGQILKITDKFEYEVWQPDLRADKIYSHSFENGLTHRLFPAKNKLVLYGFKPINHIYSGILLEEVKKELSHNNIIVHLNGGFDIMNKVIIEEIKAYPSVFSFHGEISPPLTRISCKKKNFASIINLLIDHMWLVKNINNIDCVTYYHNDACLDSFKKIYKGKLEKITMGCDFSFFRKLDKYICRQRLGLPKDKFIMLTDANFIERKQIDKFIQVLLVLMRQFDFIYILIGHGTEEYEKYLRKIALPLLQEEKIKFCSYVRGEKLVEYLNSADLFISTSRSEGGPVAVMEAFACELPVFSTKIGSAAELMEEEKAGVLVGIKEYEAWEKELGKILANKVLPKVLDRNIAKENYDWPNVARRFIAIYNNLV